MKRSRPKRSSSDDGSLEPRGPHVPVLLGPVIAHLQPRAGETYIDATFGAGGYSRAILAAADCHVLALDRDPTAVRDARPLCDAHPNRLTVVEAPFSRLDEVARVYLSTDSTDTTPSVFSPPDGIVFDLGVSSMQLDQADRGFSFQNDGPLDMRMFSATHIEGGIEGQEQGLSAADVVNTESAEQIADILYQLGEERRSRAIAGAIVKRRATQKFERTGDLANVVMSVLGRGIPGQKHPATRTFQALRLYVNDELGELARGLAAAESLLKPGGRLVVVTFHSLEDRIVKQFLAARTGRTPGASRHAPVAGPQRDQSFRIINPKALNPDDREVAGNPRARSAKLRAAERTDAEPWPFDIGAFGLPRVSGGS